MNEHTPMFIDFWNIFKGLLSYYLKDFIRGYVYSFCQVFQRLGLFNGLHLFWTLSQVFMEPNKYSVSPRSESLRGHVSQVEFEFTHVPEI